MQPMNYTINAGDTGDAFAKGFQNTAGMMATAAEFQKAQQMQTILQQKADAEAAQRADFAAAAADPTSDNVSRLMIRYPQLSEGIKRGFDTLSEAEKGQTQEIGFSVLTALEKGKPETATVLIDQQIEASKNAGDTQRQKRYEMLRNAVIANPDAARFSIKGALFSTMGGDKYANAMKALGEDARAEAKQPAEMRKSAADASKAETEAKYAGEKARTDIENTRSTIEDRKFDQRIKTMEVALSKETNSLKREELQIKIDEAKSKRDESQRMKTAEADSAISAVRTTQTLLDDVLGDEDTLRAATGAGAWRGAIPGTESRAMAGKLEQLQNALAAENLDRLKGAMSDKDIMFIKNISANLDRYQDEEKLIGELKRVKQVLADAEARTLKKYGQEPEKAAPTDALTRLKQKYGIP